jgi:hypothetical protein
MWPDIFLVEIKGNYMVKNEFKRRSDSLKEAPPSLNQVIPTDKTKDASATHHSGGKPKKRLAKTNGAQKKSWINLDPATVAPEPEKTSSERPDDTDLERRVLAHERILQTLIAHMAETQPKFLLRLTDTFCVPMKMERHEQDYTDTDSYAEEFIRSVAGLGEKSAKKASKRVKNSQSRYLPSAGRESIKIAPSPFHIKHEGGVWRVGKNGHFHADYSREGDAWAAVGGPLIGTVQST